jgi:hypothetical protein
MVGVLQEAFAEGGTQVAKGETDNPKMGVERKDRQRIRFSEN